MSKENDNHPEFCSRVLGAFLGDDGEPMGEEVRPGVFRVGLFEFLHGGGQHSDFEPDLDGERRKRVDAAISRLLKREEDRQVAILFKPEHGEAGAPPSVAALSSDDLADNAREEQSPPTVPAAEQCAPCFPGLHDTGGVRWISSRPEDQCERCCGFRYWVDGTPR